MWLVANKPNPGGQQAESVTTYRGGGCVELRLARDHVLGLLDVGDDLLAGLAGARGQTAQGQRGTHQAQEGAAVHGIPLGGKAREFLLEQVAERFLAGKFIQAAPETAAGLAFKLLPGLDEGKLFAHRGRGVLGRGG